MSQELDEKKITHRANSQSKFRRFDQNYLWLTPLNFEISSEFRQYFHKMEFRKNSDILPKTTKNEVKTSETMNF